MEQSPLQPRERPNEKSLPMPSRNPKIQLPIRTMFILLLALLAGAVAGTLAWAAKTPVPQAALVGLGVTALAIPYFDKIIE